MQFKVAGFAEHEDSFIATVELNADQVKVLRNGRPHAKRIVLDYIRRHALDSWQLQQYCLMMLESDVESRPDLIDNAGEINLVGYGAGCDHCIDVGSMTDECDIDEPHGTYMLHFKPVR